jgi:hypothetical protein
MNAQVENGRLLRGAARLIKRGVKGAVKARRKAKKAKAQRAAAERREIAAQRRAEAAQLSKLFKQDAQARKERARAEAQERRRAEGEQQRAEAARRKRLLAENKAQQRETRIAERERQQIAAQQERARKSYTGRMRRRPTYTQSSLDEWASYSNPSRVETVDAKRARQLLRLNVGNRPVDKSKVKGIAQVMRSGIFKRTKPITFTNGLLTDGQHTLLAIIESGKAQKLKIAHKTVKANPALAALMPAAVVIGAIPAIPGAIDVVKKGYKAIKKRMEKNPALSFDGLKVGEWFRFTNSRKVCQKKSARTYYDPAEAQQQDAAARMSRSRQLKQSAGMLTVRSGRVGVVRVKANPATKAKRNKAARRPSNVSKLYKTFQGVPNSGDVKNYFVPEGAPADLAQLGKLDYLILEDGQRVNFTNNPAVLCASGGGTRQKLYIGLKKPYAAPNGMKAGEAHNFGKVHEIGYTTPKPHLYKRVDPINFYHHLGEDTGQRPSLILKNGRLALRGQAVEIRREGIVN